MHESSGRVLTVTLNPCLDWGVEVERLLSDDITRVDHRLVEAGGKGVNVARSLQLLNIPATNLVFVAGSTGKQFLEQIQISNLEVVAVQGNPEHQTRVNLNLIERKTDTVYRINEAGPVMDPSHVEQVLKHYQQLTHKVDWVILSGSLPSAAPQDLYRNMIAIAQQAGCKVALDSDGEPLSIGIKGKPDLIKPNIHELQRLSEEVFSDQAGLKSAIEKITYAGVREVVVSQGSAGALGFNGHDWVEVSAPSVHPISTVGLGDALIAGLVYGAIHGLDWSERVRFSVTLASATALTPGVAPAQMSQFKDLYHQSLNDVT